MSDGAASITGSPTIDRAIHWMSGNAEILDTRQATTETRTFLDFDAETPAPPEALLLSQRSELQNTVAQLEATVQRAMADNEAKDRELSALKITAVKTTAAPPQVETDSANPILALANQVATLTEMMGSMQKKLQAYEANQGDRAPNQGDRAPPPKPSRANPKSKPSSYDSSRSSDEAEEDWLTDKDESGPACISIFSRSVRYKVTDPDRVSDHKDVDGVDSDYKRISDKRPHLLRDATNTTGKRGSEVGDLARALHSRLADSLEPQPSLQCSVGISVFALHDKGDQTLQRKIQNALMAARGCKSSSAIQEISQQCREYRRIPAALLTNAGSFSDSALIMAIKQEAMDGTGKLILALWNFIVLVISMDCCPTTTLDKIRSEWTSISCEDVEDALQQEHDIYQRAEKLLCRQTGNKCFSTFADRLENMLAIREKTNKTVREKFYARLDLDNLTVIEINWDDAWDRIINADMAASRQRTPKKKPKEEREHQHGDPPNQNLGCVLHGECGHSTSQCRDIAKLGAHPTTIKKLKHRRLCVWDYYAKCGKGSGCNAANNSNRCPFKHLDSKELYEDDIRHTLMLATPGARGLSAMPAIQEEDPEPQNRIHMPMVDLSQLPIPDEPSLPKGLYLGAMVQDKDDVAVHFPCVLADYIYDSEDSLYN